MLARFEADLGYVAATELHPGLRREGFTHLVHLVSADALREAAAAAARGHQHFAGKVSELEGLFGGLKADVEALFMQVGAPSCKRAACLVTGAVLHLISSLYVTYPIPPLPAGA